MEPLLDPLRDRFVENLTPPPQRALDRVKLYPRGISHPPDWIMLRDHLKAEGRITKEDCLLLVRQATELFKREKNILELNDPVTIVGSISGQYYDLLRILELGGDLSDTKYLFLGNYVNRSDFSIEVALLLYSLKLNFPQTVLMLRGSHECRYISSLSSSIFKKELLYKYDTEVYDAFMESFDALPLACIVNDRFIALHGGISPELSTLKDIANLNRFQEPPREGLFHDLLWSDPIDNDTGICPKKYVPNTAWNNSFYFGVEATNMFLKKNGLVSIIRSHETQQAGYKLHKWNGSTEFPCVITIFSAPNYCDIFNNKGAILKIENNAFNIQQNNWVEPPYCLPNFMGAFEMSIPHVIEEVMEIIKTIIQPANEIKVGRESNVGKLVKKLKRDIIKEKICRKLCFPLNLAGLKEFRPIIRLLSFTKTSIIKNFFFYIEIIKNKFRKVIKILEAFKKRKVIMALLKWIRFNNDIRRVTTK